MASGPRSSSGGRSRRPAVSEHHTPARRSLPASVSRRARSSSKIQRARPIFGRVAGFGSGFRRPPCIRWTTKVRSPKPSRRYFPRRPTPSRGDPERLVGRGCGRLQRVEGQRREPGQAGAAVVGGEALGVGLHLGQLRHRPSGPGRCGTRRRGRRTPAGSRAGRSGLPVSLMRPCRNASCAFTLPVATADGRVPVLHEPHVLGLGWARAEVDAAVVHPEVVRDVALRAAGDDLGDAEAASSGGVLQVTAGEGRLGHRIDPVEAEIPGGRDLGGGHGCETTAARRLPAERCTCRCRPTPSAPTTSNLTLLVATRGGPKRGPSTSGRPMAWPPAPASRRCRTKGRPGTGRRSCGPATRSSTSATCRCRACGRASRCARTGCGPPTPAKRPSSSGRSPTRPTPSPWTTRPTRSVAALGVVTPVAFDLEWYATAAPELIEEGYAQVGSVDGVVELAAGPLELVAAPARRVHRWGVVEPAVPADRPAMASGSWVPFLLVGPEGAEVLDRVVGPDGWWERRRRA